MPHSTETDTFVIDGQHVDVAALSTVDYQSLRLQDPAEITKLLKAAESPGFFYLDLQNEPRQQLLSSLRQVYGISEKHFTPDEHQAAFEISRDKMRKGSVEYPPTLAGDFRQLEEFAELCHDINKTVLSALSDALGLGGINRLENNNRDDKPSETALNLIYSPAKGKRSDAPDTTHTDTGTLTSLFCDQWGIMIEHPETKVWQFVEPKPGCALMNVADSLQKLSGGKLHSCRHRHTQAEDGFQKRYFVVSYLRPETVNS